MSVITYINTLTDSERLSTSTSIAISIDSQPGKFIVSSGFCNKSLIKILKLYVHPVRINRICNMDAKQRINILIHFVDTYFK